MCRTAGQMTGSAHFRHHPIPRKIPRDRLWSLQLGHPLVSLTSHALHRGLWNLGASCPSLGRCALANRAPSRMAPIAVAYRRVKALLGERPNSAPTVIEIAARKRDHAAGTPTPSRAPTECLLRSMSAIRAFCYCSSPSCCPPLTRAVYMDKRALNLSRITSSSA